MNEVTKIERGEVAPDPQHDPMVSMIERVVMSPNTDLDKLERMLAMKERMDAQNASRAYAAALSAARAEIPPIIKDATVDFTSQKGRTHYKHETLAGIAKTIDPILSKHGLSYRFRTDQGNGGVRVTCIVQHMDGHSEETSLYGSPDGSGSKNSFQAVGSAVTYLQRYTLKAALGLSAEVDDDAQSAAQRPEKQHQEQVPKFNPRAAADRIITKLRRAARMDDLSDAWVEDREAIASIKAADGEIYAEVEREKNERKTQLAGSDEGTSPKYDDEVPY